MCFHEHLFKAERVYVLKLFSVLFIKAFRVRQVRFQ